MDLVKWISISLVGIVVSAIDSVAIDIIVGENIPLAYKLLFIFFIPSLIVVYMASNI